MQVRTTRPVAGNKYFIRKANGGYSSCIQGSPTDSQCNVLANCVGYACGAFNEECNLGYEKYDLNCNAENFIERAIARGLSVYKTPQVGDIICWQKGATLSGNDGAGHVAIVIEVIDSNTIRAAESGWGSSTPFYIVRRSNSNGKWGAGSGYSFRGFIRNPYFKPEPKPTPVDPFPGVSDEELARRVWTGEFGNGETRKAKLGIRYDAVQALVNKGYGKPEPAPQPKPEPTPVGPKFAVGQKVRINIKSSGYAASADGTGQGGRRYKVANGWVRLILRYHSGKPFPYQVGNATGTTGFFKEEDLQSV